MPEGDTIHYAANKIRPVLEGHVPDSIETPHPRFGRDRWPQNAWKAAPCARVDAHGKNLFIRFENGLTIHSHLRMTGKWRVRDRRLADAAQHVADHPPRRACSSRRSTARCWS